MGFEQERYQGSRFLTFRSHWYGHRYGVCDNDNITADEIRDWLVQALLWDESDKTNPATDIRAAFKLAKRAKIFTEEKCALRYNQRGDCWTLLDDEEDATDYWADTPERVICLVALIDWELNRLR